MNKVKKAILHMASLMPKGLGVVCLAFLLSCVSSFVIHKVFADDPVSTIWDFSNTNEYSVSDSSAAEILSGTAQLKVLEYSNDANTMALFHFNETSGSSVTDSSSYGLSGTAAAISWSTSGKLNGAGDFNGSVAQLVVPDSSSISLLQSNTLEAWIKPDSAFSADNAVGGVNRKMGIFDKGTYQLYLDNNTGKLTYELADASINLWEQVGGQRTDYTVPQGSWDLNGKASVSSIVSSGNYVYVGLGAVFNGVGIGDAEVWRFDLTTNLWTKIGGDGTGASPSTLGWEDGYYDDVPALAVNGDVLYAGLGNTTGEGEVWKYENGQWTKIGGDGSGASPSSLGWPGDKERIYRMIYWNGTLYAGMGLSRSDAELWAWDGSQWSKVGGDGTGWANNTYEGVYSLAANSSFLFVGLGVTNTDSDVYMYDGDSWTKIGGDGTGWANGTYETVQSMAVNEEYLFVGLGTGTGDAEVYRYSIAGSSWSTRWGGDGIGWANSTYEVVYDLLISGSYLYAGLGAGNTDAEVYRTLVAGSSWSKIAGDASNKGWSANNNYQAVRSLASDANGNVYAGVYQYPSGTYGTGELWRYNGTDWEIIGGEYVNDSWGYGTLNAVMSMAQVDDSLYVGTGLTVSSANNVSGAFVFEYSSISSAYDLIGGQGIYSGWGSSTYGANVHEAVTSLAQYQGQLYAGLGSSQGDGEIWRWSGSAWSQIGGDGTGFLANSYEAINVMLAHDGYLYAGLGNTIGDAEVYRYDGSNWSARIGGDQPGASAPATTTYGWITNRFERVLSMVEYQGRVHAGLGDGTGDAEIWSYSGSNWTRVGGSGTSLSWNPTGSVLKEGIYSMAVYKGDLYAGLGYSPGDAEVWKYDGTSWSLVGGDGDGDNTDSPTGWAEADNFERVRSMAVYNGELYVGLGYSVSDGEVWRYNGSVWNRVAGDGSAGAWANNTVEEVYAMNAYNGRLFAGVGLTANVDASLWAYGSNAWIQSPTSSWGADWYHVAATYDGSTMRMYIDGDLVSSASRSELSMVNTTTDLLIGTTYGGPSFADHQGYFDGLIDGVRVSNTARTSFNTKPYSDDPQTITAGSGAWGYGIGGIGSYAAFVTSENGLGEIKYRLSNDNGISWDYWDGDSWETSDSISNALPASEINAHISDYEVTDYGIKWQAVLEGNGDEQVKLSGVNVQALDDTENPTPPTSVTTTINAGSAINPESFPDEDPLTQTWFNSAPTFEFSGAGDTGGAGIAGYWVYFGSDSGATPSTAISSTYYPTSASSYSVSISGSGLTSGSSYYLRIQTKDKSQRLSSVYAPLVYRFDNVAPNNPPVLQVQPSELTAETTFNFEWEDDSVTDCSTGECSGVAGYMYKTGAVSGTYANWSAVDAGYTYNKPGVGTMRGVYIDSAPYKDDANYFYLKSVDNAGNMNASHVQAVFNYAGSAPLPPTMLTADPESSNTNSFIFSWSQPASFSGEVSKLSYCYLINSSPAQMADPEEECNWTAENATSVGPDNFATMSFNTFYIFTKDEAGQYNSNNYETVNFRCSTSAPGMPLAVEIADVSVKSLQAWKLAITWERPSGALDDTEIIYQVYSSDDGVSFVFEEDTGGESYVSTDLTQVTHYYKVKACDNTNNCGAFSEVVSMLPTGRFTSPPVIEDDPEVSNITTQQATISWFTDRSCDSKIRYGTSSGDYYDEEPSNSTQTVNHEIALNNLSPGTKYYITARWTDEDGNTGESEEITFETTPAPIVTDPSVKTQGISSITLQYTVEYASKVRIYYGKTSTFGGVVELSTSVDEATYNTILDELEDGTKYYYKINTFDEEDEEYEGSILSFETLPRPKIDGVKIQQVVGTAQPTVLVSWSTNTEVSSIVTYYPEGNLAAARDEVNVALTKGEHRSLIRGLLPQTPYQLYVKGRDKGGNEATSESQRFTTATDTRPPAIQGLKVEGAIVSTADGNQSAQLVASWDTDEGATSQVEFGEGTGDTYSQKTQEDSSLTFNHVVVLSGLTPSKVYHLRAVSRDKADNFGNSVDTVVITPKSTDSALNLVITNLQQVFGFLGNINR